MDRLREEGHGERSGNCESDRGLELTSATRRCGGGTRPIMDSKLRGIKPYKCVVTHDVLAGLELWGLLVPVLPPAVVGAGVGPGLEAAGAVAVIESETAGVLPLAVGAEAPEDAVRQSVLPTPTVTLPRVD